MRVAFAGAHRTGKSTLIEAVAERLPGYEVVDEPYYLLEEEGYELSDPPVMEDFERQLRRSLEAIRAASASTLLDRSPLDFIAYMRALDDELDLDDWIPDVREAMEVLDLIVVVTIETPDRIPVPPHEDACFRRDVDALIRTFALDDPFGFATATLEARGDVDERARQVLRAITAPATVRP